MMTMGINNVIVGFFFRRSYMAKPMLGFSKVCKVPVVLQGGLLAYIAPATEPQYFFITKHA